MTTISSARLYRAAALAGIGSSAILLVNAAKRAQIIPTTAVTQLLAPLAQILALALVTALFAAFGRKAGIFGAIAFALNAFSLAALVGVEFVINLVFVELPPQAIADVLSGPLGVALTLASVLFLLGTLLFAASLVAAKGVPLIPLSLYAIGAVPVALRAFVPELVLDLGLAILALGIGALSVWLLNRGWKLTTSTKVS